MKVFETSPRGFASAWYQTGRAFHLSLAAVLFLTLLLVFPAFAQQEPAAGSPPGPSEKVSLPEKPIAEAAAPAPADEAEAGDEEVKSQLDELAALLEHEIRDLPTITCLAVFSLGILMGRLLR